ncbi:hypothetical protein BJV74DRAFT_859709 [Russula compacta]|nr:hypothetical protein BJV74DRAFT_859709 [Russula compacta]
MTTITRHLPWFIKDLGISIVGQKCYVSLVENLNIDDVECIKYSLSKGIGVAIVVGGTIMKVPQLLLILRAQSARGLSLTAYILETLSYAINLAYSSRNGFPFSTYGENLFLTIQNIFIIFLIILFNTPSSSRHSQRHPIPPLPQIAQNHRARSTGQLSAFAVISQIGGCAARLFTTAQEVNDPLVGAGFALALALNLVLGVQMYAYWGKGSGVGVGAGHEMDAAKTRDEILLGGGGAGRETGNYGREKVDIVVPPQSPSPSQHHQAQHQPSPSATYGRKWARKVD